MAQPTAPTSVQASLTYPEDIENIDFYMSFMFSKYNRSSVFQDATPIFSGDSIVLPFPVTINEHPSVVWNQTSGLEFVDKTAGSALRSMVPSSIQGALGLAGNAAALAMGYYGYTEGRAINPYLIMLFQQPSFKKFRFSWLLAPRTSSESDKITKIVKTFKRNMLPGKTSITSIGEGAILEYPMIVQPRFHPEENLFKFKYCAVDAITIDYTAAQVPAMSVTNAPMFVRLDLELTEIDLWFNDDRGLM